MGMTSADIVKKRSTMPEDSVDFYVSLAESMVRQYLGLDDTADISPYSVQIADIAILLWQKDESNKNISSSLGYQSESFSEGNVSTSHTLMTGASIGSSYDESIDYILSGLTSGGKVVFI